MSDITAKDGIDIERIYSDQDERLNSHEETLSKHSKVIGSLVTKFDQHNKDHDNFTFKVKRIEEDVDEMKPLIDENTKANMEQSILMKNISENVEGMRKDFKTMFRWLLGGFTVVIVALGGFLIWTLKIIVTSGGGGGI